jgi:hypothetical protein
MNKIPPSPHSVFLCGRALFPVDAFLTLSILLRLLAQNPDSERIDPCLNVLRRIKELHPTPNPFSLLRSRLTPRPRISLRRRLSLGLTLRISSLALHPPFFLRGNGSVFRVHLLLDGG